MNAARVILTALASFGALIALVLMMDVIDRWIEGRK
jgi:hypothetical protein